MAGTPLFTEINWDFGLLRRTYDEIEKIAVGELGLDYYPVQIEVITSEQMLDAYAVSLPTDVSALEFRQALYYHETLYRKGSRALPTRSSSIRTR